MKKLFFSFILLIICSPIFSQISEPCKNVKLGNKEEIKAAEPCISELADYVLSKKMGDSEDAAHKARTTINSWMEKTPDYTFSLNTNMMKLFKGENITLFGVYLTTLAKAAIENKEEFAEPAMKIFVEYIKNPDNKVAQTKEVEKLLEAFQKDAYDKYVR